jgi:hypothetical protein
MPVLQTLPDNEEELSGTNLELASRTITEKWKIGVYSSPAMDYEY